MPENPEERSAEVPRLIGCDDPDCEEHSRSFDHPPAMEQWFDELSQEICDVVDELKIWHRDARPFALRLDAALYKANRAREREKKNQ